MDWKNQISKNNWLPFSENEIVLKQDNLILLCRGEMEF